MLASRRTEILGCLDRDVYGAILDPSEIAYLRTHLTAQPTIDRFPDVPVEILPRESSPTWSPAAGMGRRARHDFRTSTRFGGLLIQGSATVLGRRALAASDVDGAAEHAGRPAKRTGRG